LSSQSTPVMNPTSNNAVRVGCSTIIGKGNSSTPTAYVDVYRAFPANLTGQAYDTREPVVYDPNRQGQGNHAWPYTYILYGYDLTDLAAVKAGTKLPYKLVPYAMWDIRQLLPNSASSYGQIYGVSWDAVGRRLFVEIAMGDGYPSIVVLSVDNPNPTDTTYQRSISIASLDGRSSKMVTGTLDVLNSSKAL